MAVDIIPEEFGLIYKSIWYKKSGSHHLPL